MNKRIYKVITMVFLIGCIVTSYFMFFDKTKTAEAGWWDYDWNYRQSIEVTHSSAETNVYITVTLDTDTASASMQVDCGDFRFTSEGGEILPYYISSGCRTINNVIHINLATFPAGAQTIYFYYGNLAADDGFSSSDFLSEASNYAIGTVGSEEIGSGPVGYWSFDEGYGTTAHDESSGGNDGTISGATWQDESVCVVGKCLFFDGSDEVTFSGVINVAKTVNFWVKATTTTTSFIDLNGSAYVVVNSGVIAATGFSSPTIYVNGFATTVLETNKWQMITVVSDTAVDASSLIFGNISSSYFSGLMDEVKIYPYARTADKIKQDYNAGLSGVRTDNGVSASFGGSSDNWLNDGLLGYWKMDENTGTVVADSSMQNNNVSTGTDFSYDWYEVAWLYRQKITIDNTKVETSLTNFPVLVNLDSDPFLASHAQADGDDLVFTDANNNKLDHEIESYNSSTGELTAWVEVASLSESVDTTLYLYYGNAVASSQQNVSGTWDEGGSNNYKAVWHLGESTGTADDSTGNPNDGTFGGDLPDAKTGVVGNGQDFDGSLDYINVGSDSSLKITSDLTISGWFKSTNTAWQCIFNGYNLSSNGYGLYMNVNTSNRFTFYTTGGGWDANESLSTDGTWHYYVGSLSGTTLTHYFDGEPNGTDASGAPVVSSGNLYIGYSFDYGDFPFLGMMDELRISNIARSAGWAKTSYNNQNSPTTFLTVEGEVKNEWYNADWRKRKAIQIDETKVAVNLTNFPMLINLASDSGVASSAQADGDDLLFTNGLGVKLDHEIESYTSGTGALTAWVEVDTVASSTGTTIFMYYGNPEASNQENPAEIWDADYAGVWHMAEDPSISTDGDCGGGTDEVCDSTVNNVDADSAGVMTSGDQVTAKLNGGIDFDGSDDYLDAGDIASVDNKRITVSAWVKTTAASYRQILDKDDGGVGNRSFQFRLNAGKVEFVVFNTISSYGNVVSTGTVNDDTWHYVVGRWDGSTVQTIIDSSIDGTKSFAGDINPSGIQVSVGRSPAAGGMFYFDGIIDEVRLSTIARSDGWLTTEFNNQSSASTFYSLGNEEGGSGYASWTTGKFGSCIDFNGTDSVVNVGNISTQANTISFWLQADSTTESIIDFDGGTHTILVSSGVVTTNGFSNPTIYIDGAVTTSLDTNWHHVLVTTDTGFNVSDLNIGKISSEYFDGRIDDVRLYNKEFSLRYAQRLYEWGPAPLLHLKMDEKSGVTAYDTSGNENNGNFLSDSTSPTWARGKYGSALEFDGEDDTIIVSYSGLFNSPDNMTVSAWVYRNSNDSSELHILSGALPLQFGVYQNKFFFYSFSNWGGWPTGTVMSTSNIEANSWHYLTATYNGSECKVYVDGMLENSDNKPSMNIVINHIAIGSYFGNSLFFDGKIDDVKIYSYARTQKQILEDMNAGTPAIKSQLAYYKFDEGYGTTVNDSSGKEKNLTLSVASSELSGKFGRAYSGADNRRASDGADDDDLDFTATDDFSISAWVKYSATNPSATEYIVHKQTGDEGYAIYMDTDGDLVFGIGDTSSASFPEDAAGDIGSDYADDTWHHVVGLKKGNSKIEIFVDGESIGSDSSLAADATLENAATLYVGDANATDGTDEFLGDIDEVKIYNFALTVDDIKADYNQGKVAVLGGGSSANNNGTTVTGANKEYCVPGDTAQCDAPVMELKMDEKEGLTTYDVSGNGFSGVLQNGAGWSLGKKGSGISTDGVNDSILVNTTGMDLSSGAGTIEYWFKDQGTVNGSFALAFDDGGYTDLGMISWGTNGETVTFYLAGRSVANMNIGAEFWDGEWHQLSVNWLPGAATTLVTFYVDGVQTDQDTVTPGVPSVNSWRISGYSNEVKGIFDEYRIFNYARTPAQIAWDYNRGKPVGLWRFDECQGITIHDESVNGNNGTLDLGASSVIIPGTCVSSSDSFWYNGRTGKTNSGGSFDGTDDYVDLGDLGKNVNSISFWLKPDSTSENIIDLDGGTHTIEVSSGVIVANGFSSPIIYVDGLMSSEIDTGWHNIVITTTTEIDVNDMDIGRISTNYFDGTIDEVKIYNYALTVEQIKNEYNGGAVRFN